MKTILKSPLSKKRKDSNTNPLKRKPHPEQLKLLSRANEVCMDKFIACICRNEYEVLLVSGKATASQLAEAWASLFYEYVDLIGAEETKHRVRLAAEINLLDTRIKIIESWLKIIEVSWSKNIVEALNKLGYSLSYENAQSDIASIRGDVRADRLNLKVKKLEFDSLDQSGDTIDEAYFRKVFFRINNYARREAVNGQTSVQDYCVALKDFQDYIKIKLGK